MIFMKDLKQITALYKLFSTMDKETARKRNGEAGPKASDICRLYNYNFTSLLHIVQQSVLSCWEQ